MKNTGKVKATVSVASILLSLSPVILLISVLVGIIMLKGASYVADFGPVALLMASFAAIVITVLRRRFRLKELRLGIVRSMKQLLPAVPILICIALISTTWMLSGIVPLMIDTGLELVNPQMFLFLACAVSAVVSVLLGSSWTTIATVGVAFMGIGSVLGFNEGWIAGAIISGAYFGDKVSPLSDTTVIASQSCGVDLFTHIRNLMCTSIPAMTIALALFLMMGVTHKSQPVELQGEINQGLSDVFSLSPWLLVIPAITIIMCVMRVRSLVVLLVSAAMGLAGIFIFQPGVVDYLTAGDASAAAVVKATFGLLLTSTSLETGTPVLDDLLTTGGVEGMLPTVILVLCAMTFGGVMIGTGMLGEITRAITSRINSRRSLVTATAGTGLMLNSSTADQYLSIIIGSNIYRNAYKRSGLESKLLSRTLEDSISVTSPLIPWNSCGITQSTVLGVATLTYLPFCFFNYLSPLFTILLAAGNERLNRVASRLRGMLERCHSAMNRSWNSGDIM